MSHARARRSAAGFGAGLAALVLMGLGVGVGLVGPAYAAKPTVPSGQVNAGAANANGNGPGANSRTATANGTATVKAAPTVKAASTVSAPKAAAAEGPDHSRGNAGTSGDVSSPQPRSNADNNGGGANHTGPYDSTREGSPSMNGHGGGKAKGKPCAGCVGKADNKNPKGQHPNGSDRNAGYECDRNHGVGRSNPAHTGCRTTTPPEVCPPGTTGTPPNCTTVQPPGCVDLPETPMDVCGTPPGCVDNPATQEDECGSVTPPGHHPPGDTPPGHHPPGDTPPGKHHAHGQAGPPASNGVLPNTGAPDGLLPAAFGGMALSRSRRGSR